MIILLNTGINFLGVATPGEKTTTVYQGVPDFGRGRRGRAGDGGGPPTCQQHWIGLICDAFICRPPREVLMFNPAKASDIPVTPRYSDARPTHPRPGAAGTPPAPSATLVVAPQHFSCRKNMNY